MTNWIMLIIAILLLIVAVHSLHSYIRDKRSEFFSFRRKK
ncbi:TPA: small membrane protein [Klebsiella aerogenes]|nr:small membrane protein [Klebsiella aerogenes]EKM7809421.1 small membrane protein [Klebsiella aerogenes]EKU7552900.1 small membrane protein [Klebsiella aerogenes]EKZ9809754.1 small membrane protein [Klebsiella aerogenes]ELA0205446.1 small membrane protein [Klebsiella aerogenes]ELA0226548.1 small membrane protein [Klebsiella aerogenes]